MTDLRRPCPARTIVHVGEILSTCHCRAIHAAFTSNDPIDEAARRLMTIRLRPDQSGLRDARRRAAKLSRPAAGDSEKIKNRHIHLHWRVDIGGASRVICIWAKRP